MPDADNEKYLASKSAHEIVPGFGVPYNLIGRSIHASTAEAKS
ncbi:MAG: hypothetical protein ABSD38_14045 [Syntrophorhabdales bacterium]|jgi:hypothetical protein